MTIRLVGVDPSIASTGLARADIEHDDGPAFRAGDVTPGRVVGSWTGSVGVPGKTRATVRERRSRLARLGDLVAEEAGNPDLYVIEGPAPGLSSNRGGHDLSGGWWLIVDRILDDPERTAEILVVAPPTLKLYIAGHGHADKPEIVKAVRRHYGAAFDLPTDRAVTDVADAIGLLAIGARYLGVPIDEDHPTRLRAMDGLTVRPAVKTKPRRTRRPAPTERTPDQP